MVLLLAAGECVRLLLHACVCAALQLSVLVALLLDIRGEDLISYTDFRRLPSYLHAAARAAAAAAGGAATAAGARGASTSSTPWWLEALLQGPRQATQTAAAAAAAATELRDDLLLLLAAARIRGGFNKALSGLNIYTAAGMPIAAAETDKVGEHLLLLLLLLLPPLLCSCVCSCC